MNGNNVKKVGTSLALWCQGAQRASLHRDTGRHPDFFKDWSAASAQDFRTTAPPSTPITEAQLHWGSRRSPGRQAAPSALQACPAAPALSPLQHINFFSNYIDVSKLQCPSELIFKCEQQNTSHEREEQMHCPLAQHDVPCTLQRGNAGNTEEENLPDEGTGFWKTNSHFDASQ